MSNPTMPQNKVSRFVATLRRLGGHNARLLSSGLAVAALASVADPALLAAYPQLASLTALLGGNLLASHIDRMANATSEGELQQTLDQLLAHSELAQQGMSETQFQQLLALLASQATSQQLADVRSDIQQIAQTIGRLQQGVWVHVGRDMVFGDVIQGNQYNVQGDLNIYHAPPSPDDMALLKPYLETVARQSKTLRLAPLDSAGQDAEQQAISLGQVYVDLEATAGQYTLADGQPRHYRAALAHLHYYPHLILLGNPGSGKTTFVRYVASELAQGVTANLQWLEYEALPDEPKSRQARDDDQKKGIGRIWGREGLIPLYLEMRDFARTPFNCRSPLALWEYAAAQLAKDGLQDALPALRRQAQAGRVLWLLDGVDEVPIAQRKEIWQAIGAMHDGVYGGCPWLATCRVLSFKDDEAPPRSHVTTLQPLNPAQIERFIERWYEALVGQGQKSKAEGEALGRQLRHAARTNLRELAPNPMLLTIMALVQTYRGTLPDERAKLYQACVETLLVRWQQHKDGVDAPTVAASLGVSHTQLEELLAEIAWVAHSKAPERQDSADISEEELIQLARKALGGSYAKAELFVEYTERRAHLLVGKGGEGERFYSFPHRTFQEYLAACHLASVRRFGRQAPKLASQGDMWWEVLALATGELVFNRSSWEYALEVVERVLPEAQPAPADTAGWYRVWLAGEMATVIGRARLEGDEEMGQAVLSLLRQQLVALLQAGALTPRQRAEAGDVLAALGDPRAGILEVDEMGLCYVPAGRCWLGNEEKEGQGRWYDGLDQPYWLAQYPVTVGQWRQFVQESGYKPSDSDSLRGSVNRPVIWVNWYDSIAFCTWLDKRWRAKGWLPEGYHVTLPSEAEWEKGARGGIEIGDRDRVTRPAGLRSDLSNPHSAFPNPQPKRPFPWGNEPEQETNGTGGTVYRANYDGAGIGRVCAVGSFPAGDSPVGCAEMSGHVWEWTRTLYDGSDPTQPDPRQEVMGKDNKATLIIRGGSFRDNQNTCSSRGRLVPHLGLLRNLRGLRVCVSPLSPPPAGL